MTDIASLELVVDSSDVGRARGELASLTAAGARAENQADQHARAQRLLAGEMRSTGSAARFLASALGAVSVAAAAGGVANLADSYTRYTNSLRVAGLEGQGLAATQQALFASAQRAGAPLEALGTLYGRGAMAAKDLGASQKELLTFTDLVATSLKVGGKSATESSGALLQLSQVLGGAKVQAEEYNSLIDGLRPLLIAVAAGSDKWGGSVSKLTQDVKAQKVTSSEFFDSALRGKGVLDDLASKTMPTLAQSFTRFNNALGQYVGQANEAASATSRIASGITVVSDNLDKIVPVLGVAIAYVGVRWAAAGAQFVATEAARVAALGASINAERAAAISAAQLAATRAAAQASDLAATQGAIVLARQEAVARLQAANAAIAANRGTIAGTAALGVAERQRSAALRELAVLGGQAAAVNGRLAASNTAAAAATTQLAAAQRVASAGMVGLRGAAGGLVSLLGGPWGIALTAAAAGVYFLHRAMGEQDRRNDEVRESLGGARKALDEYEMAALEAVGTTGKAADAARKHAEQLRKEAEAAVTAAKALREKSLAEAEAADAAASRTARETTDRIKIAGIAGMGSDPMAIALAGTAPLALAESRAADTKTKAKVATEAATAAEARYAKILAGSGAAANSAATAVTGNTSKKKAANDATADFIKGLRDEVAEIGKTEKELRALEIARAVAATPLAGQKAIIEQLGAQREAALTTAAAWERLAELKAANDERTMSPVQRLEASSRTTLNDVAPKDGTISILAEELRLSTENAAAFARALALVPTELRNINDALPDDVGLLDLQRDLDALQILESQAVQAAQNIGSAFGKTGVVIGTALTTFSNFRSTEAALSVQVAKGEKTQAQATKELANARVRGYGDMAAAAKTYFKEGSTGYKVLQTAEIAFRTIETLNSIQAMARKGTEVATHVAAEGTKASASGATAYAVTLASLPFPFNLAAGATVLAALASVGVAIAGGGRGGGAARGSTDAQDRQNAQGTGTVLGDPTAKSDSIARALEIASRNTNRDLEYSNQMVRSLRSIDANIGSLTAVLARELGVDSFLSGSSFQGSSRFNRNGIGDVLSTAPLLGGFLGSLFGTKTTQTLQDSGIQFADQSIADILAGGVQGQAYQQILTTRKKKFLGVTTGTKSSVSTEYGDLSGDLTSEFTRVIASLRDGVIAAAGVIGIDGADATLDAFRLSLGTISTKDLKGDELQAALSAIIGKAADQMTSAVIPSIEKFQQVGEGAFETFTRLARDYQVVDVTLRTIGKTFSLVGLSSLEARERLIAFAGGLDALQEGTAFFAENFLTDAERLAPIQSAVNDELKRLGLESIKTRDQFKQTVLGLDVTTEAGAELYASLITLAPAFAQVTDATEDLVKRAAEAAERARSTADAAVNDARDVLQSVKSDLQSAYSQESSQLRSQIDAFTSVTRSLREYGERLAGQGARTPRERLDLAQSAFQEAAAAVRANPEDREAYNKLQSAGDTFIAAAKSSGASVLAQDAVLQTVRREIAAAGTTAKAQADTAIQQLNALNLLVAGQLDGNKSLLSTTALLGKLAEAQVALVVALSARAALDPAAVNDNFDPDRYLAGNKDIAKYAAANGLDPRVFAREHYFGTGRFEEMAGLRRYAAGTNASAGGLALVGETGPEPVLLPQGSKVIPNERIGEMFGGSSDGVVSAVDRLNITVQRMQAEAARQGRTLDEIRRNIEHMRVTGVWSRGETPDDPVKTVAA